MSETPPPTPPETPPATPPDPPLGAPAPPPPPAGDAPRRLTRSGDDRMIAGVAGGLGRHFGVDPLLFRIGFVVLTFFGGAGLLLYLLLALLVPSDRPESDPLRRSGLRTGLIIVLVIAACIALPFTGPGFFVLTPFLVLAAVAVLIYRAAGGRVDPRVTKASLIAVSVVGAGTLGFAAAAAVAFGAGAVVSGIVLGLGLVLILAGLVGGARWLIVPALILAIPVGFVAAADIDLKGGVGERDYRPASVADIRDQYRLGVGELQLDLRDVDFPSGVTALRTRVGIGSTQILLPEGVCLDSTVDIGAGEARIVGHLNNGVDVQASRRESARGDAPVVRIESEAGFGEIVIRRPSGTSGGFQNTSAAECSTA